MKARIFTHIAATATTLAALMVSFPLAAQAQANSVPPAPPKYTVQVLPGLGGGSGAFSNNNRGWAAGVSNPPDERLDHAILWRDGQPTDLGTLGGYNSAITFPDENDNGWLAGASETADNDPYQENFCGFGVGCTSTFPPPNGCAPVNQTCKGFLWRSKTNEMIALPPLPGGNNAVAFAVNDLLQVVGAAENGVLDPTCVGMNGDGLGGLAPQVFRYEAVVWSLGPDGTPFISQQLPPIAGDTVSVAGEIDQHGNAVGASGPCASVGLGIGAHHAVLWQGGRAIDLGSLGGAMNNIASAINQQGQVVGISDLSGDIVTAGGIPEAHAFLWERGTMKDLGTLPAPYDTASLAESINDRGEVVGFSCDANGNCRGFLWRDGVTTDLTSVLVDSPLVITNAASINSRGEIAVQAVDPTLPDPILGHPIVAAVLIPRGSDGGPVVGVAETKIVQREVILTENVRKMLQRRSGFGGFRLGR
jgi:probable HAF family extracellular repeat protein